MITMYRRTIYMCSEDVLKLFGRIMTGLLRRFFLVPVLVALTLTSAEGEGALENASSPDPGWKIDVWYDNSPDLSGPIIDAIRKLPLKGNSLPDVCDLNFGDPALALVLPEWRNTSTAQHADAARASFVQRGGPAGLLIVLGQELGTRDQTVLREELWRRYGAAVTSLLSENSARFQETDFDIDGDGTPERFYRSALLAPPGPPSFRPAVDGHLALRQCSANSSVMGYSIYGSGSRLGRINQHAGSTHVVLARKGQRGLLFQITGNHIAAYTVHAPSLHLTPDFSLSLQSR